MIALPHATVRYRDENTNLVLLHEYSTEGAHRIRVEVQEEQTREEQVGNWTTYESFASLDVTFIHHEELTCYHAYTEYSCEGLVVVTRCEREDA